MVASIDGQYDLLPFESPENLARFVKDDLRWCSEKANQEIEWLLDIRHNALSHHGESRMTFDDVSSLDKEIHYSDLKPDLINKLYHELAGRINRYYVAGLDTEFEWKDWYIDEPHRLLVQKLEESLSA